MLQQMRSAAKYIWIFLIVAFVGGFLLMDTSGLLTGPRLSASTPVATVNGRDILYQDWLARTQQQIQQEQQRSGRALSQDEVKQVEDAMLEQMIQDILLQEEYERRAIMVSDAEIREYAQLAPPSWIMQEPSLQTEGRFDPDKYRRLLGSSVARQQGLLVGLETYYRTEIPKQKLFDQVSTGLFLTDAELWRAYQDRHDSVSASYVVFRPAATTKADASIPDSDLRRYFDEHKDEFSRQGRASLSVVHIARTLTGADSAAVRSRLQALRAEIVGGAKFEDVARRESSDSGSAANGGDLGRGGRGRFVPEFETAAYALRPGEVSQPVATQFGVHLIKLDSRVGDTLALRHILLAWRASDSSAVAVDRRADELARLASGATEPAKFDAAAKQLGLPVSRLAATEGEPAVFNGRVAPGVSAWAFSGAQPGETSELFDADDGYYLARLDSLTEGGEPRFDAVKDEIRMRVTMDRAIEALLPKARAFAAAAAGSSLEAAAQSQALKVEKAEGFTRASFVPGLGQLSSVVGAAFGLPAGRVSAPIRTGDGVFVLRVDNKVQANRQAFEAQKATQREQQLAQLRQARVQLFMQDLRKAAKVVDRRKDVNAMARRAEG